MDERPYSDSVKLHQIRYRNPIKVVKQKLATLGLKAQSDIWIYPEGLPGHWTAAVAVNDRVFIFSGAKNRIVGLDAKPCGGFRPNGTLIF